MVNSPVAIKTIDNCEYRHNLVRVKQRFALELVYFLSREVSFGFYRRIVAQWNSLRDNVVSSASINMIKNRLDKFLYDQYIYYNWEADLAGSSDHTNIDLNVNFHIC